jgi:serine protease AprX
MNENGSNKMIPMDEKKRKIVIIFLLGIIIAPSFLFFEIPVSTPKISSLNLSQNYSNSPKLGSISENPSLHEQINQKVSQQFQKLLDQSNDNQLISCIVLLAEQPSNTLAQQMKTMSGSSNRFILRKSLYYETKKMVLPMQNALNLPIASLNGTILRNFVIINAIYVEIPLQALPKLAELPQIARIEPDYELQIQLDVSNPIVTKTTSPGWDPIYNGSGVVVAVCDTGIDKTHPNLVGRIINECSFVSGESADDFNGHGTHVAGIIASNDNTYRGIAYGASLVNVKVMNSGGSGQTSDLYEGIEWLLVNTTRGADVINLSAGTSDVGQVPDGDSALSKFIDTIVSSYNIVWVNAAGNSGSASYTIEVPGDAINCISVANFDDHANLNPSAWTIAGSSSRGPTDDERKKPDIAAPGTDIISCNNNWEGINPDFVSKTGTSMSTPHVAGAAALLWQYLSKNNASLETRWYALTIKGILLHTAYDLGSTGYDYNFGYGAVDLGAARNFLQKGDFAVQTMNPPYSQCKYRLDLASPQIINATVVWNRYGSTNFTHTFYYGLSNINLILQNEDGVEIASSKSGVDNVEHISYPASNGTYYLLVEVVDYNHEPQEYVICASSHLTFAGLIHIWSLYEILMIVSIVGIIIVAAVYIVLWLRERKANRVEKDEAAPYTSTWPEWEPARD